MEPIEGVIFDLDGTLYSLPFPKLRLTLTLLKDLQILRHLSPSRATVRGRSFSNGTDLRDALFEELGTRARIGKARAQRWYEDRFLEGFIKLLRSHGKPRPGLNALLALLTDRNVKLGVISDYGVVAERLRALGIDNAAFDGVYGAEDFGCLKPAGLPFTTLAETWDIDPSRVIVVGDRRKLDEESAKAAGMGFLGIANRRLGRDRRRGFVPWHLAAKELEQRTDSSNVSLRN